MTPHAPGPAAGPEDRKARLVEGFRILARYGLGARVAGHLTARMPDGAGFWTHRFGLGFEEIGPGDLVSCHLDLSPRVGPGADAPINPTMHIHAQIYRARADVQAIAHTHGAAVVALSATGSAFVPCSQMAGIFHGDIDTFDEAELVVLTPEDGAEMAGALAERSALILKNHGSLVVGRSIEDVVLKTVVLEEAAAVQLRAMAAGRVSGLGAAAAAGVKRFVLSPAIVERYWDYEVRRLGRPNTEEAAQ